MAEAKISELKSDLSELKTLLPQSSRQRIKDILSIEIRKIETELATLHESLEPMETVSELTPVPKPTAPKRYQVKLNNYSWDQSDKSINIYVTLKDSKSADNVSCTFTDRSVELVVKNVSNRDYMLTIKNLLGAIDAEKSHWKVKTDMVVIYLIKKSADTWSHVTEVEKRASDSKKLVPEMKSDSTDPTAGLMDMMKKMYETGDDDMKRMIAKAWTEGQDKKSNRDMF